MWTLVSMHSRDKLRGHLDGRHIFTTAKDVQVQGFATLRLMPVQQLQQLCVALLAAYRRQTSCLGSHICFQGGFTGS